MMRMLVLPSFGSPWVPSLSRSCAPVHPAVLNYVSAFGTHPPRVGAERPRRHHHQRARL